MSEPLLSRFTPSLMSAEALEAIFVQREALAQRLVELIHESAQGESKQHTLVVGPRGIGKTHLVALIYHRLQADEDLKKKLLIAWLREEEWGISSFLDLLLRVLSSLRAEYGNSGLEEVESFFDLPPAEAERRAGDLLVQYVGSKSLLLIAENLDEIFSGLGLSGQKRFRAFLQERGFVSILATSQSLFNGVSLQTSPFYGFFRVHHLAELDHREAVQLLTRVAQLTGKSDLASALGTPEGRARVRAVHHLAGGNPRIYIIFSQFLTRDSLDELVGPMIALLDDLTPYYQARMAWLSPQQRKIVELLCDRRGAVTVKEIAKQCFVSQQSASSQLKTLRDAGYVLSLPVGRESYYEIREPLMRLCMEVKKHRGEPVRLLVDFLRLWYSRGELETKLAESAFQLGAVRESLLHAVKLSEANSVDPRISACTEDLLQAAEEMDFGQVAQTSDEILAVIGFRLGGKVPESQSDAEAIQLALMGKAMCCLAENDWDGVLSNSKIASSIDEANPGAWAFLGNAHFLREEWGESLGAHEKALSLGFKSPAVFFQISKACQELGFRERAVNAAEDAVSRDAESSRNWLRLGEAMCHLGRFEDGLKSLDRALSLEPGSEVALQWRFVALAGIGRIEEAIQSLERAFKISRKVVPLDFSSRERVAEFFYGGEIEHYRLADAITSWALRAEFNREKAVWKIVAVNWVKVYQRIEQLSILGVALVRSALLFRDSHNRDAIEPWLAAWKEAGAGIAELEVPLKLLEGAARFLETNDERALLELSSEERRVVEALLAEPVGESSNNAAA